jgi:hypothetical protein
LKSGEECICATLYVEDDRIEHFEIVIKPIPYDILQKFKENVSEVAQEQILKRLESEIR